MGSCWAQATPQIETDGEAKLSLILSNYIHHYSEDASHKNVMVVGLEREYIEGKIEGLGLFSNSFGQTSVYLYPWGSAYKHIGGVENLFFKWTAGVLYGYLPPYDKKVPLNYKGLSPAAVIALGYEFRPRWSAQVNALGNAAWMLQFDLPLN
jgi:hypothetical protein